MIKMSGFLKNKWRAMIIAGILCLILLSGTFLTNGMRDVNKNNTDSTDYKTLSEYSGDILIKYRSRHIGDASNVSNLLGRLPLSNFKNGISLTTENKPYGLNVHYDFTKADMDIKKVESIFKNNALIIFTLIENVDVIVIKVGTADDYPEYRYTRSEFQKSFEDELWAYSKDAKSFDAFLRKLSFRIVVFPERYTPAMSSVPGMRISAEYQGSVGSVRYTTQHGIFYTWDTNSGYMSKGVKNLELSYGNPAYWSPLEENVRSNEGKGTFVTVTILDPGRNKIDEKQLDILYDGSMFYTIRPSSDIVVGNWGTANSSNVEKKRDLKITHILKQMLRD